LAVKLNAADRRSPSRHNLFALSFREIHLSAARE
jgi:hypothetical protein